MTFPIDENGVMRFDGWIARSWLTHGFSSRVTGDFRSRSAWESGEMLSLSGPLITLKQVHSHRVVRADGEVSGAEPRCEGDALISATVGETIGVRIADCLPLLIVDPVRRAAAAAHAGWRGTAAQIAKLAVERMRKEYGSRPEQMEAVIGPCISATCYEVGEEVAGHFDDGAVRRVAGRPRPFVDLAAANRIQLENAGLLPRNIHGGLYCTFRDERFHSHRRDGESAGRMIAYVGLR